MRVHKVLLGDREEAGSGLGSFLPVFVFVFTKMLRVEGRPAMKVRDGMASSLARNREPQSGIANKIDFTPLKYENALKKYFRSY